MRFGEKVGQGLGQTPMRSEGVLFKSDRVCQGGLYCCWQGKVGLFVTIPAFIQEVGLRRRMRNHFDLRVESEGICRA